MNDEALAEMVKTLGEYVLSVYYSDEHSRSQKIHVQSNAMALIEDVGVHFSCTEPCQLETTLDRVLENVTLTSM